MFGKRALACATPLPVFCTRVPAPLSVLHSDRNQIFLGGQHLGAYQLSPGLHRISQRSAQSRRLSYKRYTYIGGPISYIPSQSPVPAFLPMNVQNSPLLESMTWGGKEMMEERCRGIAWMVEALLIKATIRIFLSHFSNQVFSIDIPRRTHQ